MRSILVPTDLSPAANNAMRYAIRFAHAKHFSIRFFYCVTTMRNPDEFAIDDPQGFEQMQQVSKVALERNVLAQYKRVGVKPAKLQLSVKVAASFESGMMQVLAENKSAMIILGTHGQTNLKDVLMGSNAAHIVATSPVPVLCIPAHVRYVPVKELAYFTDLDHITEELKLLKGFGRTLHSKLAVIHFDYGWARTGAEEKLIKKLSNSPLNFTNSKVNINTPFLHHIRNYARSHKNTLVCLFHDRKGPLVKLVSGSNAEEAPAKVHAPILSFQRAA